MLEKNHIRYFQKKRRDYKEDNEINITRKIQKRTTTLLFSNHLENNKFIKISQCGIVKKTPYETNSVFFFDS